MLHLANVVALKLPWSILCSLNNKAQLHTDTVPSFLTKWYIPSQSLLNIYSSMMKRTLALTGTWEGVHTANFGASILGALCRNHVRGSLAIKLPEALPVPANTHEQRVAVRGHERHVCEDLSIRPCTALGAVFFVELTWGLMELSFTSLFRSMSGNTAISSYTNQVKPLWLRPHISSTKLEELPHVCSMP